MNIQEAKQIRIADYLQSLGYTPVKQLGNSLWPYSQAKHARCTAAKTKKAF